MAASLELRNVYKLYPRRSEHSVQGLSFTCYPGEFVAIVGPSGCGKSTTLRMIAGLETVTSGDILIDGKRVNDLEPHRRGIGLAFETYSLYPPLSVFENIAFNLKARGVPSEEIRRRVEYVARATGIEPYLQMKPAQLSGGQKQRVNIARAIVREPKILLLDEPLSHLDAGERKQMRIELKRLHEEFGMTTVLVTHDQREAMSLADRIVVMNEGVLQQFDTAYQLYAEPVNYFVASFIGDPGINLIPVVFDHQDQHLAIRFESGWTYVDLETPAPLSQPVSGWLGVRPEDIALHHRPGPKTVAAAVKVSEFLGEQQQVELDIQGVALRALVDGDLTLDPGQSVAISFRRWYAFDGLDGHRIIEFTEGIPAAAR